ncbi:hypothetical protein WG954_01590 [Lacibacter sp. H375]|uniref:hypothetical protein n=1 Tax=Lacibacter sp. H375 TaxID=3133424 RepID=UPI0030BEEEEC
MAFSLNKILVHSSFIAQGAAVIPTAVPFYEFDLSSSQEDLTIKLCSGKSEQAFCIYLKQTQETTHPESFNQAILCLTHPYYLKEGSMYLLLADNSSLNTEIKDYMNAQGFDFRFLMTDENDLENLWSIKHTAEIESLKPEYEKRILSQHFLNKWIIIEEALNEKDLLKIVECLDNTEAHFKAKFPFLETIVITNRTLTQQNCLLEEENKYLTRELEHYKVFNQQLKDQDESEKILHFYHKEYEQLPLWYKRFGHVIKIIMGKRKLSSLYKKEKD